MNRRSSAWTGRAARSLNEAFGPYCTPYVQPAQTDSRRAERVFVIACLACLALGLVATYWIA